MTLQGRTRLFLLALSSIPVGIGISAQDVASSDINCPVDVVSAVVVNKDSPTEKRLSVMWKNTSGKEIVGAKFGAVFFDPVDEPFQIRTDYVTDKAAKPDDAAFETSQWPLYSQGVAQVDSYPIRIKFSDGSYWKDNGTRTCNGGVALLGLAKHGGLRAISNKLDEIEKKTTSQSPAHEQ